MTPSNDISRVFIAVMMFWFIAHNSLGSELDKKDSGLQSKSHSDIKQLIDSIIGDWNAENIGLIDFLGNIPFL